MLSIVVVEVYIPTGVDECSPFSTTSPVFGVLEMRAALICICLIINDVEQF